MKYKTLIFDFDGVIADTKQIAFQILSELEPTATMSDVEELSMGNVYESNKFLFTKQTLNYYDKRQKELLTPNLIFDIVQYIRRLSQTHKLFIISSSDEILIETFLTKHSVLNCFTKIYGKKTHFSKVIKFKMLFKEQNITPTECVFITDTLGDLYEAQEVHVPSIAVSWGYHSQSILEKGEYLAIVHSPKELFREIQKREEVK